MYLFLFHYTIYWYISIYYYLFDLYIYKNKIVDQYKNTPITKKYWKYCNDSFKTACLNQFFISLPFFHYTNKYISYKPTTIFIEITKLLFYVVIADIWFFSLHYLFHKIPFLYNYHKFHHRQHITAAVAAADAHPIEHFLINLGSAAIGPILWNGYFLTLIFWTSLTTAITCLTHSGYNIPFIGNEHILHHKYLKCNYGHVYLCDKLFNTYKK